jgi:hypothetical protein
VAAIANGVAGLFVVAALHQVLPVAEKPMKAVLTVSVRGCGAASP